jgi:hypothetical protein
MQLLALTACSALTAPSIFKNPIDLNALSRRELQALAKQAGLRANQKSADLIASLQGETVVAPTTPAHVSSHTAQASSAPELPADLTALSRKALQELAKQMGVRANQKTLDMIAALEALRHSTAHMPGGASDTREPERAAVKRAVESDAVQRAAAVKGDAEQRAATLEPASAGSAPAESPLLADAAVVAMDPIERPLPPELTPSRCVAGRFQPLRLIGDGVELTYLVRETRSPLDAFDVSPLLELPPLRLGGKKHRALRVHRLPVVELSTRHVAACVKWTAHVIGLLGMEDERLFPAPTLTLHGDAQSATPRDAPDDTAALLFAPSRADLQALQQLAEPAEWTEWMRGEEWPTDGLGEPLVVLGTAHRRRRFERVYLPTSVCLQRGESALAQFVPSDTDKPGSDNPKNALQIRLQRRKPPIMPEYATEQLGEQLFASSVSFEGAGPFRGNSFARKRDAEKDAARVAIDALDALKLSDDEQSDDELSGEELSGEEQSREEQSDDERSGEELSGEELSGEGGQPTGRAQHADQEKAWLWRFAHSRGGYLTFSTVQLGLQRFAASIAIDGVEEGTQREATPQVTGEPARSKKLAQLSAMRAAMDAWAVWDELEYLMRQDEDESGSGDETEAGKGGVGEDGSSSVAPISSGWGLEQRLVVPLRASTWRGASCALVFARALAHAVEVGRLHSELSTLLRPAAVPPLAELRLATTPRGIGGYRHSNEQIRWVGNAVLGLCCKVAAVVVLGEAPRHARRCRDSRYDLWTSNRWLATRVRARGWERALLLPAWPGDNGVTCGAASASRATPTRIVAAASQRRAFAPRLPQVTRRSKRCSRRWWEPSSSRAPPRMGTTVRWRTHGASPLPSSPTEPSRSTQPTGRGALIRCSSGRGCRRRRLCSSRGTRRSVRCECALRHRDRRK